MFGKKYIEEEIRKRIDSMKQLDRIEFYTRQGAMISFRGNMVTHSILVFILGFIGFIMALNFFIQSAFYSYLSLSAHSEISLTIGFISFICGFIFTVLFICLAIASTNIGKELDKRLETFLEEHSK